MPERISPRPVTGGSSFSSIVEFRALHLEKGREYTCASPLRLIILFFDAASPNLELPRFFFFRFRPVFTEESGVIVRSRYEQQARQKPDEPADSLGKHLTKNDAAFPRAVSTPSRPASFCFNPLRSSLSPTIHTNTCQRRVCAPGTAEFTCDFAIRFIFIRLFFL